MLIYLQKKIQSTFGSNSFYYFYSVIVPTSNDEQLSISTSEYDII